MKTKIPKIFKKYKRDEAKKIAKAFYLAEEAHNGQKRKSGEDYFDHPLNVAIYLAENNLDYETVIAGFLHDLLEDTKTTKEEIEQNFGTNIAKIVEGVTKLNDIHLKENDEVGSQKWNKNVESLRKLIIAMAGDVRVMIVKLADRLHNMKTIDALNKQDRERIALETMEIYAPLANRLGMGALKAELEDLSFQALQPFEYKKVVTGTRKKLEEKEQRLDEMVSFLKSTLKKEGVKVNISSRVKHSFSIYKKLKKTDYDFSKIYDLLAIRIIVPEIETCYKALGIIHANFKPLIYRIKDYIAVPKPNGYRSLHTTIFGLDGKIYEIQIRTKKMHEEAEKGVAAHWNYDENKIWKKYINRKAVFANQGEAAWVKELLKWQEDAKNPEEFMDGLKIDIFKDRIFVFSPLGDVYDLPEGATPVDFAYEVHTELGEKMSGAKVNGKIFPIDGKLENRDIVEIITSKSSKGPKRDWLGFAVTSKAKQKIKAHLRHLNKDDNAKAGRQILKEELELRDFSIDSLAKEQIKSVLDKLPFKNFQDLLAAIGEGSIGPRKVALLFYPNKPKQKAKADKKSKLPNEINVLGVKDVLTNIATCCEPIEGDVIKGFITRGKGITIHKKNCINILNASIDRIIDVDWGSKVATLSKDYKISAKNRAGLLSDISECITGTGLEIVTATVDKNGPNSTINFKLSGVKRNQFKSFERRLELIHDIIKF